MFFVFATGVGRARSQHPIGNLLRVRLAEATQNVLEIVTTELLADAVRELLKQPPNDPGLSGLGGLL